MHAKNLAVHAFGVPLAWQSTNLGTDCPLLATRVKTPDLCHSQAA